MAEIVLGIASSHTPQLGSGTDMWRDHAERDRRNPLLLGRDARCHTYDELLASPPPGVELRPAVWEAKYRRCQEAIIRTGAAAGMSDRFATVEETNA